VSIMITANSFKARFIFTSSSSRLSAQEGGFTYSVIKAYIYRTSVVSKVIQEISRLLVDSTMLQ